MHFKMHNLEGFINCISIKKKYLYIKKFEDDLDTGCCVKVHLVMNKSLSNELWKCQYLKWFKRLAISRQVSVRFNYNMTVYIFKVFSSNIWDRGLHSRMPFSVNRIFPKKIREISCPEHLGTSSSRSLISPVILLFLTFSSLSCVFFIAFLVGSFLAIISQKIFVQLLIHTDATTPNCPVD